jgi:hypothetical protein
MSGTEKHPGMSFSAAASGTEGVSSQKIIVSDWDETLVFRGGKFNGELLAFLEEMRRGGCRVIIASRARPDDIRQLLDLHQMISGKDYTNFEIRKKSEMQDVPACDLAFDDEPVDYVSARHAVRVGEWLKTDFVACRAYLKDTALPLGPTLPSLDNL